MALISNSHICPHLAAILSTQTEGCRTRPLWSMAGCRPAISKVNILAGFAALRYRGGKEKKRVWRSLVQHHIWLLRKDGK